MGSGEGGRGDGTGDVSKKVMKDYARMTSEQQDAYNEGLLDAIDKLQQLSEGESNPLAKIVFMGAKWELASFRNAQINASPQ